MLVYLSLRWLVLLVELFELANEKSVLQFMICKCSNAVRLKPTFGQWQKTLKIRQNFHKSLFKILIQI